MYLQIFENDECVASNVLIQGDLLLSNSGAKMRIDSLYQYTTYTATAVYNLDVAGNSITY